MDILFLSHLLNGLLMIAMPVGLAIFLTKKFGLNSRLWWIGAATFVLSQVGHIPFNAYLINPLFNQFFFIALPVAWQKVISGIILGLSAGLFEEGFRYGMYRWWAKDARSWKKGLLAGAGHGGAEAILLGLLVLYGFIQMAALRHSDLSVYFSGAKLDLAQKQVLAYWSMDWAKSMLGALERFFTIPVQICFSVLVLQTFIRKQRFWVWLAVLYHACVDATAVIAMYYLGVTWTETLIGLFAVLSVILILVLRTPDPDPVPPTDNSYSAPVLVQKPVEATKENLENTRYQ
jgi:uncharacterized membrane protein YhfC